jgi:hypothetical protein
MQINSRSISGILIFFVSIAAWWYTGAIVRPELHYFLQQSAFLTDKSFFMSFASYPGGLADYLSEFVSQFFYFNTFGSLLIVVTAALMGIMAVHLVRRITGKSGIEFSLFSFILILSIVLQSDYHYPFYASVRLLITFFLIWIYSSAIEKIGRWEFLMAPIMTVLSYYLAGGAALFVFTSSLVVIHLKFSAKKADFLALPFFFLFSGVLPYLTYQHIFLIDFSLVYTITHSKSPMILFYDADYKLYALYAFLPTSILTAFVYSKFKRKQLPEADILVGEKPAGKYGINRYFGLDCNL